MASATIIGIYLLSLIQQPRVDRQWDEDHAKSPKIDLASNQVTIENFRNNLYRSESDYDARFGTRTFELNRLSKVWFLVQRFTTLEGLAHTFVTFQYDTDEGPEYFSISVEIRREEGEVYSPIQGIYRRYELIYVIGDERDLIGVRTVMRPNDRVFMYETNATPEQVQSLFVEIAERANQLAERPEFYNTFVNNCTNNIVRHTYKLTPKPINWLDPRIVLPGYSDRFAFEKGLVGKQNQSFDELPETSRIDEKARAEGITGDFSAAIRK